MYVCGADDCLVDRPCRKCCEELESRRLRDVDHESYNLREENAALKKQLKEAHTLVWQLYNVIKRRKALKLPKRAAMRVEKIVAARLKQSRETRRKPRAKTIELA